MNLVVDKKFCSRMYIEDMLVGVLSVLAVIFQEQAFQMVGEEKSMELFIRVTSPDRLDDPRKGSELWDHLKAEFSKDGGIDHERIAREMGDLFLKDMGRGGPRG